MERKIKLIWDFRGEGCEHTAAHHAIHLKEFFAASENPQTPTGSEKLSPVHAIAHVTVPESQMVAVRDRLKPHRGTLAQDV
ncbi:MAG: hypothetical protein WBG71_03470 [Leeuwenhoekiella sp.]